MAPGAGSKVFGSSRKFARSQFQFFHLISAGNLMATGITVPATPKKVAGLLAKTRPASFRQEFMSFESMGKKGMENWTIRLIHFLLCDLIFNSFNGNTNPIQTIGYHSLNHDLYSLNMV